MRTEMKFAVVCVALCVSSYSQNIGINYTGVSGNDDAILDLDIGTGTKRGLLIPRVALTSSTDQSFGNVANNNPTSLLVYHTGGGGLSPGFYYWDGTQWRQFLTNANYPLFNCATSNRVLKRDASGNIVCSIINDNGTQAWINITSPPANDVFSVGASGGNDAINGYAASGVAIYGESTSWNAIMGISGDLNSFGVWGHNSNTSGTGVAGSGNNGTLFFLAGGSGGAFTGTSVGVYGRASGISGTIGGGLFSTGNTNPFAYVALIDFTSNTRAGGYFDGYQGAGDYAYVGVNWLGTDYKINGGGTVSTIVSDLNNNKVNMFCPEAPEVLFMDYGEGQLVNGRAYVKLDPIFAKNIVVNEKHPLRVFVQLEGDCKGVYVTNKSQEGFEVVELDGGTSNVKFTWMVVANRADEYDDQGNLTSKYADVRFPPAPPRLKSPKEVEVRRVPHAKIKE